MRPGTTAQSVLYIVTSILAACGAIEIRKSFPAAESSLNSVVQEGQQQAEPIVARNDSPVEKSSKAWEPGNFSPDANIIDGYIRQIQASIGLKGRLLGREGAKLFLDDGSFSGLIYPLLSDGGGVVPKDDSRDGYYYMSNSEVGVYPPYYNPDADRKKYAKWLTGGTYALEFNEDHEFIGYEQRLGLVARSCAGGITEWGSYVSCEEFWQWGRCWQVDPEGKIDPRPTNVTAFYGIPWYGLWEAFAWWCPRPADGDCHGYVTDDDVPDQAESNIRGAQNPLAWRGTVTRFTPDDEAMACYNKPEKKDRWCTLESGTHDYLRLNPDSDDATTTGTYEWVSDINEATPGLYGGSEGIDVRDGLMTFIAKREKLIFFIDLESNTYVQDTALPDNAEPDNIRVHGDYVWICVEGPGLYVRRKNTTGDLGKAVLFAPASGQQTSGIDFSPDGTRFYLNFYGGGTWQFWRDDGLSFGDVPGL